MSDDKNNNYKVLILDVDGVMTDGKFFYDENGKSFKIFGPDDSDALGIIKHLLEVRFVTGDRKGFKISKRRIVDDMGFKLDLVSTLKRLEWIEERYDPGSVIYMGDGIFDHFVMQGVGYSIAPQNSLENTKKYADFVTERSGGERAVAEAVIYLLDKFFVDGEVLDKDALAELKFGEWGQ